MGPATLKNIIMEESIFGFSFTENVSKKEMFEVLKHKRIGTVVINIYMR